MSKYSPTLNLPKTSFPIKSSPKREEEIIKELDGLYKQLSNPDNTSFILHDGPPYANGNIHHGHILNKVLKDIVYKSHSMMGYNVDFKPGWDCHGLPIETEVDKKLGTKRHKMSKLDLRAEYRQYAEKFVNIQREQFKRLGVTADWDNPYLTMDFKYEAQTLRELDKFVNAGLVYRDVKPVFWCPTHLTALANNDIEYKEDHKSNSVFVLFPLAGNTQDFIVVWTTTPWTLSVNKAVAVGARIGYAPYLYKGRKIWLATDRAEALSNKLGYKLVQQERQSPGTHLVNLKYVNPISHALCPIVVSDHVSTDSGTGLVHIAPAHGEDDFKLGKKHNLEIENAIGDNGSNIKGLRIHELNQHIIDRAKNENWLLHEEEYTHRYPYSARSHKPVIVRATKQWFIALDKPINNGPTLRERALTAVNGVNWMPESGKNRITSMLKNRPDWCISRQRTWGVPIHAYICKWCDYFEFEKDIWYLATLKFEYYGADFWFWDHKTKKECPNCNNILKLSQDILDVWFDSGVSNSVVFGGQTADLYLEGSDQHRGWFQSSLLAALGAKHPKPFSNVLTHGFVVDDNKQKLSKSKKNFVDPFKYINNIGAEAFRLWVAQSDFRNDISVSDEILKGIKQTAHKIRNTIRYLISNLYDFDLNGNANNATDVEKYIVSKCIDLRGRCVENYKSFKFHSIVKDVEAFCINDLSSFYIEISRDTLYCDKADSIERRSAQLTMYILARMLITIMAPIMSFTMYDAWNNIPGHNDDNVFKHKLNGTHKSTHTYDRVEYMRGIREETLKKLEILRQNNQIGAAYEAMADITLPELIPYAISEKELASILGVSKVSLTYHNVTEPIIDVSKAIGFQCERCWMFHNPSENDELCERCFDATRINAN